MTTPKPPLESLDRDELLATVRRLLVEADALSSRISAVNEIGIAVNRTLDLATIQRVVAKQAKWLLDFAHLSVCLRDPDPHSRTGWRITTLFGAEEQLSDLAAAENLSGVLQAGHPRLIGKGSASPFMKAYLSQLIIPLSADNVLLGTINFGAIAADCYTQNDMRIGYMLSLQLSAAIRNAHVFAELQRTQDELRQRVEELDAYGHTVAHDLKTPVSSIQMWSDLVKDSLRSNRDGEALQYIDVIHDSARTMHRMIDQLLLLAKLRHAPESMALIHTRPVVEAAAKRLSHQIAEGGIAFGIARDIPDALGYGQWVEEIFANLISNAIKYMGKDNPAPAISVRGTVDAANRAFVRYEVQDTGLGMRPEEQARLFRKFARLHQNEAEGSGLGLSIIHRMIGKMGGTIGVTSEVGKGSTFWFTLPAVTLPIVYTGFVGGK
jgi:signal transduction histidine kinase